MSLYLFINLLYSIPGDESGYSLLSSPNVGIFPAKKRLISKKSSYIFGRVLPRFASNNAAGEQIQTNTFQALENRILWSKRNILTTYFF
jgi:hypothetical protein